IRYGQNHRDRYVDDILLRVGFRELINHNDGGQPYFCKFNSGAPRTSNGRKSPRGPDTFLSASCWPHTASEVVEVSFIAPVSLPVTVEFQHEGEWRLLF